MENLLPEDVLTNIIQRLAPRYLAISRRVCKTWCTIIDAHSLLRVDLLPRSLGGIFINFSELTISEFFSRPSKGPTISGNFDYCSDIIRSHCNGLLLFDEYVVNPATLQSAPLPPCPRTNMVVHHYFYRGHLVFDPTLSPHYEVFMIPNIVSYTMLHSHRKLDPAVEELEWPLSPCILHVFSSRTKVWEERSFVRDGEAAGNVRAKEVHPNFHVPDTCVYWRGVAYVYCQNKFVMRISLSNGKYQVIKPPSDPAHKNLYLGKSVKGVYCVVHDLHCHFTIHILDESSGKMEWVFKDSCTIRARQLYDGPGPWTLQDINEKGFEDEDGNNEAVVEDRFEWDSDNDNVIETISRGGYKYNSREINNMDKYNSHGYIDFLGFHPYKEVIMLSDTLRRGLAYHLNSLKLQDLANQCPTNYGTEVGIHPSIQDSFPYTPWMGWFPQDN
ncbi:hypothetical protein GUJ93_ZPchr0013g37004 [Zizania palustris]|nr:hypothetical protein GUJ93_ZPchr0013g37004 [Zizania palustris]